MLLISKQRMRPQRSYHLRYTRAACSYSDAIWTVLIRVVAWHLKKNAQRLVTYTLTSTGACVHVCACERIYMKGHMLVQLAF